MGGHAHCECREPPAIAASGGPSTRSPDRARQGLYQVVTTLPSWLRTISRSRAGPVSEDNGGVVAAEAERVRNGDLDLLLTDRVRDVVKVAIRVGFELVDGRRQHAPS